MYNNRSFLTQLSADVGLERGGQLRLLEQALVGVAGRLPQAARLQQVRGVEAELQAREGRVLGGRQPRAPEVHRRGAPVPPRLEHQREPQVRVRGAREPGRHVQRHLQRLRRPSVQASVTTAQVTYRHGCSS